MDLIDHYSEDKYSSRTNKLYQRERKCLKILLPLTKKNYSIIDLGCGPGLFLKKLSDKVKQLELYGVDISDFQLSLAKLNNIHAKRGDLNKKIPFESNKFDIAYAGEVIEHLYNPDSFLAEVNRTLKKGGHLLLTTPNLNSWFNRIVFPFGIRPLFIENSTKSKLIGSGPLKRFKKGSQAVGHVRIFNKDAIKDLLEDNGFKVINFRGAVFDSGFPDWLLPIDNLFNFAPSLSSIIIVLARKIKELEETKN